MTERLRFTALLLAVSGTVMTVSAGEAFAFPGMIRHGYPNCTSCHLSPAGGGTLTPYGRELSQEIIAKSSKPDEGKFLHGFLAEHLPRELLFGGDIRFIQTYKTNDQYKEARFFGMQEDIEVAWNAKRWAADASFGNYDQDVRSLKHYLMYRSEEQDWSLRAGRFRPAYGINTTEHTLVTKRNLGWDEGTESYNLEAAWIEDSWNLFLTGIAGFPEPTETEEGLTTGRTGLSESGASARYARFFDTYEIGWSAYYGSKTGLKRGVTGPFATLGFSPKLVLLSELDFQRQWPDSGADADGLFNSNRLVYEPVQGLNLFATAEWARPDFKLSTTMTTRYGLGTQLFPRPHFELELVWHLQKTQLDASGYGNFAWALLHYWF